MPNFQPHQQRVIDKLNNPDGPHGLIAYHSLGSGKTMTALGALDQAIKAQPGARGLFVVPASLQSNVFQELKKHKFDPSLARKIDVMSYERAANIAPELKRRRYALAVFDEAHRLRNKDTKRVQQLKGIVQTADKALFLTGTAAYNHPADMASLINIINPDEKLPDTHTTFENEYINGVTWQLKPKAVREFRQRYSKYIDKYDTPKNSDDFPTVDRRVVEVQMTPEQAAMYKTVQRSIPEEIRVKMRKNLPLSLKDANRLNVFSQGIRQVSDSTMHHDVTGTPEQSSKIMTAVEHMAQAATEYPKGFRGVAYSNYIDAGLVPYQKALEAKGIKPLVFTGGMSRSEKDEVIAEYNSKSSKPKVLLLSSSGAEGISLKRTKLMQLLEPHFNASKTRQAEGRAIRFGSHADLPPSQRKVVVEEYQSTLPQNTWQKFWGMHPDTAIDGYLDALSKRKQGVVDEINRLV